MKRIFAFMTFLAASCMMMQAKVTLPSFISDNMVLQQKTDVAVWGTAEPDSKVVITNTWSKNKTVVMADSEGNWFAKVATPAAGGPYEMTFSDGEKLTVRNILIGEVWICSGQSNMEMPMKGFTGQMVEGAADQIMKAKPSVPIRMCTVKKKTAVKELTSCESEWLEHTPEAVAEASAVAYFFGQYLNDVLDVPVGLLITNWGGSRIQAWMPEDLLKSEFADEIDMKHLQTGDMSMKEPQKAACLLYNGMLNPVIPFTAKGFIWYQGCSNRYDADQYIRLQVAFVNMLREKWGNDKMPFYYTQIAPYIYDGPDKNIGALLMEAQAKSLPLIPYSGMATTLDIGELDCIHPAKKKEVGARLAYLALQNDYGVKGIEAQAPVYRSVEFKGEVAHVTFEVGELGVGPINMDLPGFEMAGEDKVFHPAVARVAGDRRSVKVTSEHVKNPVAVRYCMRNWSEASLFNCFGLPVSPFRTDDW